MKILFMDLDGTLLNDKKEVTPKNKKALKHALEQGHKLIICTGRALDSAKRTAIRLGLDGEGCFVVAYNGGQIYDMEKNELIYTCQVPVEITDRIVLEAKKFGVHLQAYGTKEIITEEENECVKRYAKILSMEYKVVPSMMKEVEYSTPKLLAIEFEQPERLREFRDLLKECTNEMVDLFFSCKEYLEIMPVGVSKGFAIKWLCNYLNIPLENSVAVGDEENDLAMIKTAHVGCAMKNGVPAVHAVADYITKYDCNNDGVAEVIKTFVLS
ncbi:MAG: Cof-type HAD-IIB family hydrolase [Lachnospiraceae bacterium]